jgi:hypothetical protein
VGVVEPLKVRTITAGPADAYWQSLQWQKNVHRILRRHPIFRLIGEPCSESIVEEVMRKRLDLGGGLNLMVSGDYRDATNNIDPYLSELCVALICKCFGMSNDQVLFYKSCLLNHNIVYSKKGGHVLLEGKQTWGQLMGSPISFPILCLINAACIMVAFRHEWRMRGLTINYYDLPLLINGDDCLFAATPEMVDIWQSFTKTAGLELSVGKTYYSPDFAIINSELYANFGEGFSYIPYTNQALLRGLRPKGTKDDPRAMTGIHPSALSARWSRLIRGKSLADQLRIRGLFIRENAHILSLLPDPETFLALPVTDGGLGICENDPKFSETSVVRFIRDGPGKIPPLSLKTTTENSVNWWKKFQIANPDLFCSGESDDGEGDFDIKLALDLVQEQDFSSACQSSIIRQMQRYRRAWYRWRDREFTVGPKCPHWIRPYQLRLLDVVARNLCPQVFLWTVPTRDLLFRRGRVLL